MKDVTINGATLRVDPSVKGLEADLAADGIREPYTTRAYADALQALPEAPFVVDIGANIGYYAIQAATIRPDAEVLAIEPAPETVEKLRENVALNDVADRIDIREVGVGPAEGTETLYRHSNPNRHSMSPKASGRTGSTTVPVRPLDDLLDDPGRVDALRMDIEGYEAQALRGGASVFAANDALLCNIEFHPVLMTEAENAALRERFVGHSTVHQAAQSNRKDLGAMDMAEVLEWQWIEAVFTWRKEP